MSIQASRLLWSAILLALVGVLGWRLRHVVTSGEPCTADLWLHVALTTLFSVPCVLGLVLGWRWQRSPPGQDRGV